MKYYLLLISLLLTVSCRNNTKKEKKLIVGTGNDVVVTLKVADNKNIEEIGFYSNGNSVSIYKKDIISYNIFVYHFDNKGEGTFKTCIYKLNDTICVESYVEQGYSPKMEFVNDSLIITKPF